MSSVPEHVQRITALMASLSKEDRERLAFRWIDRAMRVHLATRLALVGKSEAAGKLLALPQVSDREACRVARETIEAMCKRSSYDENDVQTFICALTVFGTLRADVTPASVDVSGVVVAATMAALYAGAGSQEAAEQLREVEAAGAVLGLPRPDTDRAQ